MKYPIGTKIEFIDEDGWQEDFKIEAYATMKDGLMYYLISSSLAEYYNQRDFFSEEELAREIKEHEDIGEEVKIKEAV